MSLLWKIAGALAVWEGAAALTTQHSRKTLFASAVARARAVNRPLVVVGAPDAGFVTAIFPAYTCGDLCVDLHGCSCPTSKSVDITRERVPVKDDSAVVYASCVLEYVNDLKPAWEELKRAAGSPDNLFIVPVTSWGLATRLFPGAKWRILSAPPKGPNLRAERVSGVFVGDGTLLGW